MKNQGIGQMEKKQPYILSRNRSEASKENDNSINGCWLFFCCIAHDEDDYELKE